nr:ABC transporter ATP-binding protein [Magnetofaba australis]
MNVSIPRGQTVGVLGRNGSGKTTLLEIISAVRQPSSGSVRVAGRVSALLALGAGFDPEFSGRDNVLLNGAIHGLSRAEMQRRLPQIQAFAGIGAHFDQPLKTYSSGMHMRLAFAAAIHAEPEILVIDEALAVGDAQFQAKCFERLRQIQGGGATILFVSHDVRLVAALCDRAMVLEQGELRFDGPVTEAINRYEHLLFGAHNGPDHSLALLDPEAPTAAHEPPGCVDAFLRAAPEAAQPSQRRNYNPHHYRIGDGRATLLDYMLVAAGEIDPPALPRNQEIEIYAKFRIEQALTRPNFGFAIKTLDGVQAYGLNTDLQDGVGACGPLSAGAVVTVRFHMTLRLNNGHFVFNLGVDETTAEGPRFCDVRRGLFTLEVVGPHDSVGVADFQGGVQRLCAPEAAS